MLIFRVKPSKQQWQQIICKKCYKPYINQYFHLFCYLLLRKNSNSREHLPTRIIILQKGIFLNPLPPTAILFPTYIPNSNILKPWGYSSQNLEAVEIFLCRQCRIFAIIISTFRIHIIDQTYRQ